MGHHGNSKLILFVWQVHARGKPIECGSDGAMLRHVAHQTVGCSAAKCNMSAPADSDYVMRLILLSLSQSCLCGRCMLEANP